MAALIGALRATLSADTANFERGMKRARGDADRTAGYLRSRFGNIGATIKSGLAGLVAGIGVGLFASAIKQGLEYAGSLGEISQQLGVTTKDLQIFRYAAGQNGVAQEQLDKGLNKLTITLGQVAAGAKAPTRALEAIGLSAQEVARMDTGQAFRAIADGLQQIPDRAQRAAVEVALFGRAGAKLDTILAGGSRGINELGAAAEKLGIILSDKQIQDADKTADKLEAMQTVLKAQIAGVVADNADAILDLANAMGKIAAVTFQAGAGVASFASTIGQSVPRIIQAIERVMPVLGLFLRGMAMFAQASGGLGRSATGKLNEGGLALAEARRRGLKIADASGGRNIGQFLASGGGGRKGPKGKSAEQLAEEAERKRLEALRDAFQFDQEQRRAQQDILRAQRDLAVNFDDRNSISVQILDAERAAYVAELEYEVAAKEKTKAQADQLLALYDQKDALERQKIIEEEAAQTAEESARYQALVMDLDRDLLESRADLAETAADRRRVELELLDFAYRQRKAALDAAIAQEKDAAALQRLTLERDRLMETYNNNRQGVINSTRGPMESWRAEFGDITEELEDLKVRGIMGAVDALGALTGGFDDFADAAKNAIGQVLAELIRLQLMKIAVGLFGGSTSVVAGSVSGGGTLPPIPGLAGGGSFNILGRGGVDKNVLSLNGLPIARVSYGERVNVSNDNGRGMGGLTVHAPITIQGNATRETIDQAASTIRRRVATVARKGYG